MRLPNSVIKKCLITAFVSNGGRWCALLLTAALAGCNTLPKEVKVPVPVPCIDPADRPQRPDLVTDADLLAMDHYKRTWALWGDRAEREVYQARLEAVVEGCSKIQPIR